MIPSIASHNESPLKVFPSLAAKVGLNEAIILQQLHYWLNPKVNKNVFHERLWVRNTYEEWQRQFPFWSTKTIQRTISSLEERGLLLSFQTVHVFRKTKYYTIHYEKLERLMATFLASESSENTPSVSGQDEQRIMETKWDLGGEETQGIPGSDPLDQTDLMEVPFWDDETGQDHQAEQATVSSFYIPKITPKNTIPLPPLTPPSPKVSHPKTGVRTNEEEEDRKNSLEGMNHIGDEKTPEWIQFSALISCQEGDPEEHDLMEACDSRDLEEETAEEEEEEEEDDDEDWQDAAREVLHLWDEAIASRSSEKPLVLPKNITPEAPLENHSRSAVQDALRNHPERKPGTSLHSVKTPSMESAAAASKQAPEGNPEACPENHIGSAVQEFVKENATTQTQRLDSASTGMPEKTPSVFGQDDQRTIETKWDLGSEKTQEIPGNDPLGQTDPMEIPFWDDETGQDHQAEQPTMSSFYIPKITPKNTIPLPPLTPPSPKSPHLETEVRTSEDEDEDRELALEMLQIWNELIQDGLYLGQPLHLSEECEKSLISFLQGELKGRLTSWRDYIEKIAKEPFMRGENSQRFTVTLDWALSPQNARKFWTVLNRRAFQPPVVKQRQSKDSQRFELSHMEIPERSSPEKHTLEGSISEACPETNTGTAVQESTQTLHEGNPPAETILEKSSLEESALEGITPEACPENHMGPTVQDALRDNPDPKPTPHLQNHNKEQQNDEKKTETEQNPKPSLQEHESKITQKNAEQENDVEDEKTDSMEIQRLTEGAVDQRVNQKEEKNNNEEEDEEKLSLSMLQLWNALVHTKLYPGQTLLPTEKRQEMLLFFLWNELKGDRSAWQAYVEKISTIRFLMGGSDSGFKVSLDWALQPQNARKVQEGLIYDKPSKSAVDTPPQHKSWDVFYQELRDKIPTGLHGDTWYALSRYLSFWIGQPRYQSYFCGVRLVDLSEETLTLEVPHPFRKFYISTHFESYIERATKEIFPMPKRILYRIESSHKETSHD